jgi:hypothetical protein
MALYAVNGELATKATAAATYNQGKPEFLVPGNQETTRPTGNSGKRKEITRKLP